MKRLPALLLLIASSTFAPAATTKPLAEFIQISPDHRSFVRAASGEKFIPWGFNYDRDSAGHLLEDYWISDWPRVAEDFREMKRLGANVVRVHLQYSKFMKSPDEPDEVDFRQLEKLISFCEQIGLYVDLTGLGCYHKQDVPHWYDALDEPHRWDAQAEFWRQVARRCADHSGVMFYDLMNEPVVPDRKQPDHQWIVPFALAGEYFDQYIVLDPAGRKREAIADAWIAKLTSAIRSVDHRHLISLGLLPNSVPGDKGTCGFTAAGAAKSLDFICVHIYPARDKIDESLALLKQFNVGKPVIVEETFPLACSNAEESDFIHRADGDAAGWISFYWGTAPRQLKASTQIGDHILLDWLNVFEKLNPNQ